MREARWSEMEDYILKHETVSMETLCAIFEISMNTVRRDVAQLLQKGTIQKVYGGVCKRKSDQMQSFDERTMRNREAKAAIGRKAAEFVQSGDIIFLDSGTTTPHLVEALRDRNVTLVTNNLHILVASLPYERQTVITLPGQLQRKTCSFTGLEAVRMLKSYNIRTAFMAATGLSLSHGVSNSSPLEYELKRSVMAQCEQRILLIDREKFGKSALLTYAEIQSFHTVITEGLPDAEYCQALASYGVSLCTADRRGEET